MKTVSKTIAAVTLTITVTVLFPLMNGCKKGQDDPFLSLRSRKNRLCREWKLAKETYSSEDTYTSKSTGCVTVSTIKYELTGNSKTETETENNSCYPQDNTTETSSLTIIRNISFDRDGTYKSNEETTYPSGKKETSLSEGRWDFNDGAGKNESKAYLLMEELKNVEVDTLGNTDTYNGLWFPIAIKYSLRELRSDIMVWEFSGEDSSDNSNRSGSSKYEKIITWKSE